MVPVTGTLVPKHDVSYGLFVQIHVFVAVHSNSITEILLSKAPLVQNFQVKIQVDTFHYKKIKEGHGQSFSAIDKKDKTM